MPLQLKNYVLTNQLLKEAIEIGEASRKKQKEYGTKVCTNSMSPPWQLQPGSRCKGDVCGIDLEESDCKEKDSTDMGDIHGHPYGGAEFSAGDLLGTAYGNKPVTCVVGQWNMLCATRRSDGGSSQVMKERYPELIMKYMKIIQPYYNEWRSSGACAVMSPEVKDAYNEIIAELEGFFDFHSFEFSDLVDATDLMWTERQRKIREQEVAEWLRLLED